MGELHALHVFDVTNNIRASLINGGRLIIIDGSILISLQLVSGCCLRLRLFPLVLFLLFHELILTSQFCNKLGFQELGFQD